MMQCAVAFICNFLAFLRLICINPIAGWMLNQRHVQINEAMVGNHLFLMGLPLSEPFLNWHTDGELDRDCVLRGTDGNLIKVQRCRNVDAHSDAQGRAAPVDFLNEWGLFHSHNRVSVQWVMSMLWWRFTCVLNGRYSLEVLVTWIFYKTQMNEENSNSWMNFNTAISEILVIMRIWWKYCYSTWTHLNCVGCYFDPLSDTREAGVWLYDLWIIICAPASCVHTRDLWSFMYAHLRNLTQKRKYKFEIYLYCTYVI